MKALKKVLTFTIILIIITSILTCCSIKMIKTTFNSRRPIRVGVLLYSFDDEFSKITRQSFEEIQKENENKMQFTFFDGKGNLAIENEELNEMIQDNFDIIVASIIDKVEQDVVSDIVYKTKQKNIPFILYNSTPINLEPFKKNQKAIIINGDIQKAAVLQGEMIAEVWKSNRESLDKNNDNIMQYIVLQGKPESLAANVRTKNSILTINNAGIKTQELASVSANWEKELAKNSMETLFLRLGNRIEVVIVNNDAMAIGAIEALQKYGYNKCDKSKYIPVFGIDGIPEAQDLIKEGDMAGTVLYDFRAFAEAIYKVSMNLAYNVYPLEGTNYKFDETGVKILIPYKGYLTKNEN